MLQPTIVETIKEASLLPQLKSLLQSSRNPILFQMDLLSAWWFQDLKRIKLDLLKDITMLKKFHSKMFMLQMKMIRLNWLIQNWKKDYIFYFSQVSIIFRELLKLINQIPLSLELVWLHLSLQMDYLALKLLMLME